MFFVKCYVLCNVKFLWNFFFNVVFLWNVFWECCVLCSVVFYKNVVCIILCVVKRVLLYFVFCAMLYFVQCYVFWNVLFCFVLFYFEPQGHCRQRCVAHLWQCSVGICHLWRPWHMISIIFIFMDRAVGPPVFGVGVSFVMFLLQLVIRLAVSYTKKISVQHVSNWSKDMRCYRFLHATQNINHVGDHPEKLYQHTAIQ